MINQEIRSHSLRFHDIKKKIVSSNQLTLAPDKLFIFVLHIDVFGLVWTKGAETSAGRIRNPLPVYAAAAYHIYCIPLITIICELLCELLVTYCETLSDLYKPFSELYSHA